MSNIVTAKSTLSRGSPASDKALFANAFIEAIHKLDLPEKRLLAHITHKMQKRGQKVIKISPGEMVEWAGSGMENYTYAKTKLYHLQKEGIIQMELEVNDGKGGTRRKLDSFPFLQRVEYEEKCELTLTLSDSMTEYIFNLKEKYTEILLSCICKFKSKYSLRLYELCKQYLNIGKRSLSTGALVQIMDCPANYSRPYFMRKKALDPAIADINSHSDILVSIVSVKASRNIGETVFDFVIASNPDFKPILKSDISPILPGIDTGEHEKNEFEILMRKAGVKGDIKDIITDAGGLEATVWYWRCILSKDVERQKPKFPSNFIRKQFKNEAKRAYALHLDQLKRKRGADIDVPAEVVASSRRALSQSLWRRFKDAAPADKLKMVRGSLAKSPNEFHRGYVEENYLNADSLANIDEERYATWIEALLAPSGV